MIAPHTRMTGLLLSLALPCATAGCGSDAEPVTPPAPEVTAPRGGSEPTAAPTPAPESAPDPVAPTPAEVVAPSGPVDLLHAVPSAVAVSTAQHASTEQVAKLMDGDARTAWNSETGDLVGAWIDVRLPDDVSLVGIALTAGFDRQSATSDLFTSNHRITQVRVTRGEQVVADQALDPEERGLQTVAFEGPGGDYRIEVVAVQPGSREDWREACVSELRVMGESPEARPGRYTPRMSIGSLEALPAADEMEELPPLVPAVFFAVNNSRAESRYVAKLEGERFEVVSRGPQGLCGTPGGEVWVNTSSSGARVELRRVHGGVGPATRRLPEAIRGATAIGCHAMGRLSARGGSWAEFDGSAWRVEESSTVPGSVSDVTIDPSGVTWVASSEGVFRRAGQAFVPVAGPAGATRYNGFVDDPRGFILVRHDQGIALFQGEGWRPISFDVPSAEGRHPTTAAVRSDGVMVAAFPRMDVIAVRSPDGTVRPLSLEAIRPGGIQHATFDGAGRLWLSTSIGVVVVDAALSSVLRVYRHGSIPSMPGRVERVVAVGALASLPPAAEADGHVRGRLTHGGAPLAGRRFVVCADPQRGDLVSMGDPCEIASGDGEYVTGGTTREDGTFDLYEVPRRRLHFATLPPGERSFFITRTSPCCADSQAGEVFDLGTIEVP